jgi:hypothetical protein
VRRTGDPLPPERWHRKNMTTTTPGAIPTSLATPAVPSAAIKPLPSGGPAAAVPSSSTKAQTAPPSQLVLGPKAG